MAERTSSSPSSDNAFATVVDLLLDFMVSKSLVASERTLRNEFQMLLETANNGSSRSSGDQRSGTSAARAQWNKVTTMHNQYTSELERRLELLVPRRTEADDGSGAASIIDRTPKTAACVTCEDDASSEPSRPLVGAPAARIPALFDLKPVVSAEEERRLRQRRGVGTPQQRVVFHDPPPMPEPMASSLAFISLPLLYNPNVNGLEDQSELHLPVGALVAGRYRIAANIGKGSFSNVYQCNDLHCKRMVSVKVLRNDKDCLDAGLGEVRVLALISRLDPSGKHQLLRLLDYMYYKEHLIIVTELLRDSLFSFYRYLTASGKRLKYFSSRTLAALSDQMLRALQFLHDNGLVHCDVKPENVCVVSASRRIFKLIDFGSAVCNYDCHNSYVQSRWYRAPEVMLGVEWGPQVDVWSFGCLLAELLLGGPLFHAPTVEAVLASQIAVMGPMPPHMLKKHPDTARMYFTHSGGVYQIDPASSARGAYILQPREQGRLKKLLDGVQDDAGLSEFIGRLLTLDPDHRPLASKALDHPWFHSFLGSESGDVAGGVQHINSFTADVLNSYAGSLGYDSGGISEGYTSSEAPFNDGRNTRGSAVKLGSSGDSGKDSPAQAPPRFTGSVPTPKGDGSSLYQSPITSGVDGSVLPAASGWVTRGTGKGPAVPAHFRDTGDNSHSHDWKTKFVRLGGPFLGSRATATAMADSSASETEGEGGARDSPLAMGDSGEGTTDRRAKSTELPDLSRLSTTDGRESSSRSSPASPPLLTDEARSASADNNFPEEMPMFVKDLTMLPVAPNRPKKRL